MFIKVTDKKDGSPIFINMSRATTFFVDEEAGGTAVCFEISPNNGMRNALLVKETPEEIMALIEQSKFKVTSGTVTTYSPMTFSAEVNK